MENIAERLIEEALKARKNAYAPYSGYAVGAALLSGDGRIFSGCNVENASYGLSNCAERTAVFKAASEGVREIKAIAITGGGITEELPLSGYAYPCGACRQVLNEFDNGDMMVYTARDRSDYKTEKLSDLLPCSFGGGNLK